MAAPSSSGGETAATATVTACAVQFCALEPPTPELTLDHAPLGAAVLRRMRLADARGGAPVQQDVLQSVDSGLTCMFVRMLKPAIYGSVWDALEIQLDGGGRFTVLKNEQGLDKRLAVKRMPWHRINRLRGEVQEDPLHEIAALSRVMRPGHPHVLKMVEALDDGETVYLLTPFVDGGELFDWVKDNGGSTEDVVKPMFRQIVDGLRYIHSRGLCHADMSLENALIDARRENAYIIDFGMSVAMPSDCHGRRLMLVPDARVSKKTYCAPEFFKRKAYDAVKIDVFSCGCMLFMMLAGFPAFNAPSRTDSGFKQAVCKSDVQGLLQKYGLPPLPDDVAHLLKAMMAYKAADRPMPEEVLRHPWLSPPPPHAVSAPLGDDTDGSLKHPAPPQQQAPRAPDSDPRDILPKAAAPHQEGFQAPSSGGGTARLQENPQPPVSNFPKGSGVAESSTPTICAEEADNIPDDAPLQEITLAKSLGPNPVVYLSMSHAVELEVQAGSLSETVNRPVTVSPRLQFVECRTEGSGRSPSHEDGRKEEFLAMTVVHGPEQASFLNDKPAKLRFFVGYVDDFSADEAVVDEKDIEQHVLETFWPLTSPNGVDGWTVMKPFSVLFPPPVLGDREVWVEITLHHFCTIVMAMKTVASAMKAEGAAQQSYFYEDIGRSRWRLRLRPRGRPPMPRAYFGNATEKHAVFTYYPIVTYSEISKEREINALAEAAAVKLGGGTRSLFSAVGGDLPAAGEGIPAVLAPGEYTAYELTCGIKEHSQMHVRVGVLVDMTGDGAEATGKLQLLDVRKISGNTILVLRPPRLNRPSLFGKIDWPCNKEIICTTQGAQSTGRP